jgi:4-amino-4-deoxy-L-arabinose transferase-like glycosyltransferase
MKVRNQNAQGGGLLIAIALIIMLIPWLGLTLFSSKGEPREAIVAVSMLQSGNWILPVNYGIDIPYKPPFLAWLIAIIAKAFNGGVVTEFISRLPSAIAAIAMVLTGFTWARKARGEHFAVIYALVTATCAEVFRSAIVCRLDMVLTACVVCTLYIMYNLREYRCRHSAVSYVTIAVLMTCATLTKGPIGSLLPCLVFGIYSLLRGDRFFPVFFKLTGLCLLSFIIPALWYHAAWQEGGEQFLNLAYEENIGRLTGTMSYDSHIKPVWYNFQTLAVGLTPWTLLLIFALIGRAKHFKWHPLKPAGLLSLTAAIVIVGFYCIPQSKRSVYLLPAYPFICYGIACVIDTLRNTKTLKSYAWTNSCIIIAAVVTLIVLQFVEVPKLKLEPMPIYGYIIIALPLISAILWMLDRQNPIIYTMLTTMLMYMTYNAVVAPMVLNGLSDYKYVEQLRESADKGELYSLAKQNGQRFYTLNYYLGDKIRVIGNLKDVSKLPKDAIILIDNRIEKDDSIAAKANNLQFVTLTNRGCDFRKQIVMAYRDK